MATKPAPAPPILMTRREVAQTLRCCERQVYNLVHRGQLRELKLGTAPRYARADVEKFIADLGGDGSAAAAN